MEGWSILQALKTHGPIGAIVIALAGVGGKWLQYKLSQRRDQAAAMQQARIGRETAERAERHALFEQQAAANKRTLDILESELKVQQGVNARFFDVLDRNTRAVEKLVEGMGDIMGGQAAQAQQLSRIEGAVGRAA